MPYRRITHSRGCLADKSKNLEKVKKTVDALLFGAYISIPIDLLRMAAVMRLSKKCQYALKAVFELALRNNAVVVKTRDIARAQGISPRFLEVILNELRHGGFVESRRGSEGGYLLTRPAKDITVGQIITYIHGPIAVAGRQSHGNRLEASWPGQEAFDGLWDEINHAVSGVCDGKTFGDLVELELARRQAQVPNYVI